MYGLQEPVSEETPAEESEKKPKLGHYAHPTDPFVAWCGMPRTTGGYKSCQNMRRDVCPLCADLLRRLGGDWWWDTHCRYYESNCHRNIGTTFHDCVQ